MPLSSLPLCYCTNVHPGRTLAEVKTGLDRFTVPTMQEFGEPIAAGLWLARAVVAELLETPEKLASFRSFLRERGLTCHTLNAFPYGDFHSERVKENVYRPDWMTRERLEYTINCANVLAAILPANVDGSMSTLPLGFRGFERPTDFNDRCAIQLIKCARQFAKICAETGKLIRLAIEPEPLCVIETTPEAVDWFKLLWRFSEEHGALDDVRTHIGLCYDVCHQAVEFEDVGESIRLLSREGIRINKVHASCALQLDDPMQNADGRAALHRFVEPRYLHQTIARSPGGEVARAVDLTHDLIDNPQSQFRSAESWRVHFHVPVDAEQLGPLGTTRTALKTALRSIAKLDYAPHIEVETYTWDVLPGSDKPDLVTGLSRELIATRALLEEVRGMDKILPRL